MSKLAVTAKNFCNRYLQFVFREERGVIKGHAEVDKRPKNNLYLAFRYV